MPTTPPSDALTNETLGELQGTMLQAILTGTPLPGRKEPIELPDLERLVAQPDVILSSENLGGPLRVRNPSQAVHILSPEAIGERARDQAGALYLRFQPAQTTGGGVLLTLVIEVAQPGARLPRLGMSGIQVTFRHTDTGWKVDPDTAAFAN